MQHPITWPEFSFKSRTFPSWGTGSTSSTYRFECLCKKHYGRLTCAYQKSVKHRLKRHHSPKGLALCLWTPAELQNDASRQCLARVEDITPMKQDPNTRLQTFNLQRKLRRSPQVTKPKQLEPSTSDIEENTSTKRDNSRVTPGACRCGVEDP